MPYGENLQGNEFDYEENLPRIVSKFDEITIMLNHLMKEATSIKSAAEIISHYFTDVIPIGELDQKTMDMIECEKFTEIIGRNSFAYSDSIKGSLRSAKLYLSKKFLEDYILPLPLETGSLYRINKGSLSVLLEDDKRLETLYDTLKSLKKEHFDGDFLEIEKQKILKNLKSSKR